MITMSETIDYKCPACGGSMEFDSSTQKMKCPFCDTTMDVSEFQSKDQDLDKDAPQQNGGEWSSSNNEGSEEETENMSVFVCESCGGEVIGDENTGATSCPYCGNAVVMKGRFQGALKPDFIIPFKVDKKMAQEKYREHIKGKFLLPKEFKTQNHIDEIKGVYVPFWLYDSKIHASANFTAEKIRRWSDSSYNYTETSYFDIYREGNMAFNNIPCDGSSKMDDDLMESIEPFDFSEAVPFQTAYLAGYLADKYDVDEKDNEKRANDRTFQSALDVLENTFKGYYTVVHSPSIHDNEKKGNGGIPSKVLNMLSGNRGAKFNITEGIVKYALYPVWMLSSTYKGEKYTFAMNGQTGKFVGNLPADKKKMWLTFLSVFAGVSAIATLLAFLFLG